MEAKLRGRGGHFVVVAVNASRSGVLLEVQDGSFRATGRGWDALARQCFRTGADIAFLESDLRVRADYARVVAAGPGQNPRIAFRFRKNLSIEQCQALRIGADDDGEPEF